ncbi:LysE family transporter [Klenkia sp. PcliD-1-E]|uniref:LysE/ArgO family amino acid transporter n=1 Tax=Klenkia sp. PcliD-1-E TaxID=2954492 RepID=UPI002096BFBC|nr:LysE family transporter [Klenkia sp. PcliD-1-E]MCO7218199.1 LysE/ArgO family amino acid transporter [Klenkia sp. PcliD-1-E]
MGTAVLAGLGLGLSLIVAIGAQNAFVLRQGLRREHVAAVVAVCTASDVVLILAGVAGTGAVLTRVPWLVDVVRVAGALFLGGYAVLAARRALRPAVLATDAGGSRAALGAVVGTALALTWLNPHVYLDTVLLLGTVAGTHGEDRWWFAAGACAASLLWFTGLGSGARALRPVFARPTAWRVLDGVIAAVMATLAVSLLLGVDQLS